MPSTMQQPDEQPTSWLTPGRLFFFSSLPLGIGTYIGYRRALAESASDTTSNLQNNLLSRNSLMSQMIHAEKAPPDMKIAEVKVNAPLLAVRALAVGSLLSVSATSLLVSSIFYASDAHSVDDLIKKWKMWAPVRLRQFENLLGIQNDRSEVREYERDTDGMSEDEEWDYVSNKYGHEMSWEEEQKEKERDEKQNT